MESSTAGPSTSSDSGPSISSSSGPAAVDSSGSKPEDSQEPGQEVDIQVVSLLSRIKSPRPSDFAQKARSRLTLCYMCLKRAFVEKKNGHTCNGDCFQCNWYIS